MALLRLLVIVLSLPLNFSFEISGYVSDEATYEDDYGIDLGDENESRIIGGKPANIEDYPHQCSFIGNNSFFCGCVIISKTFILTAAHCAGVEPDQVVLRVGSTYRTNGTLYKIKSIIAHPNYNVKPYDADLAVFETDEPIEFNDRVQPLSLPESGRKLVPGSTFTVAGWGRTFHGAPTIPERLMAVNISVVRRFLCHLSYSTVYTENMFCGGRFFFGGKGVCQGDSGGAAFQDGMVIGIVSFGRICGQPLAPSVFANVAAPLMWDFIKNNTGL